MADGVSRSYSGLVTEINLDCSDKTYGQPMTAGAILDAWRGKHTPVSTDLERDGFGSDDGATDAPPEGEDPFAIVGLYDVYRAFHDLSSRLAEYEAKAERAMVRALLISRPESVYALAQLAEKAGTSTVVRYLVLREARGLFARFCPEVEQHKKVRVWTAAASDQVRQALAEDPTVVAHGADPAKLIAWFESQLTTAGG
jgi:hypothetical protein